MLARIQSNEKCSLLNNAENDTLNILLTSFFLYTILYSSRYFFKKIKVNIQSFQIEDEDIC